MAMSRRLVMVLYLVLAVSLMCLIHHHLKPTDDDHHHVSSDCRVGYGCIRTETPLSSSSTKEIRSRKLLLLSNAEEKDQRQQQNHHNGVNADGWSLRSVPSGPDPLHHNASGPKKPQTP